MLLLTYILGTLSVQKVMRSRHISCVYMETETGPLSGLDLASIRGFHAHVVTKNLSVSDAS
jgi:hypothetical protein